MALANLYIMYICFCFIQITISIGEQVRICTRNIEFGSTTTSTINMTIHVMMQYQPSQIDCFSQKRLEVVRIFSRQLCGPCVQCCRRAFPAGLEHVGIMSFITALTQLLMMTEKFMELVSSVECVRCSWTTFPDSSPRLKVYAVPWWVLGHLTLQRKQVIPTERSMQVLHQHDRE
jgi:hypothetical protein